MELEKQVGEAAGKVWKALNANGPMSKTKLSKAAGVSPHLVQMAIGWLAREGKVTLLKDKKGDLLKLRD
jgi:hypothetical protein